MIIGSEADIKRVPSLNDRREMRNFIRFQKLWPHHGFDMLQRPRWQKYLGLTPAEATAMSQKPVKLPQPPQSPGNSVS